MLRSAKLASDSDLAFDPDFAFDPDYLTHPLNPSIRTATANPENRTRVVDSDQRVDPDHQVDPENRTASLSGSNDNFEALNRTTELIRRNGLVNLNRTKGHKLVEHISVAHVQPRTSKGITDLSLPQTSLP